jgi:hypothetical protein
MNLSADRIITVGSLQVTLPAFITAMTGIVLAFASLFTGGKEVGLMFMVLLLLQSYSINCAVVGHCNSWAWFLAITAIINAAGVAYYKFSK